MGTLAPPYDLDLFTATKLNTQSRSTGSDRFVIWRGAAFAALSEDDLNALPFWVLTPANGTEVRPDCNRQFQ